MPAAANVNTGKKDTKGRTIFKGPRGGLFVRVNGKKQKPATGRAAPAARSPTRAPAATGNVNTGQVDGEGRTIFRGPRGGLFVRVNGKKKKPAAGSPPTADRLVRMRERAEEQALKEAYGTPKIFGRKKTFLNAAGTAAVLATYPPELQCPPGKIYNPESEYDPRAKRCIALSSTFGKRELLQRAEEIERATHREGKTYVPARRVNGRYIPGHYA